VNVTIRLIPALLGLAVAARQGAPPSPATVLVNYASVAKDDAANRGSVTVTVKTGEVRSAIVWESECHLAARANAVAAAPGVDQYWTFRTTLEAASDGRPGVRVRYQRTRIAAAGPQPPEKEQWLPLDGATPLTVTESSWRKNCPYKEFTISVTARDSFKETSQ
jgi:hypothetical protein